MTGISGQLLPAARLAVILWEKNIQVYRYENSNTIVDKNKQNSEHITHTFTEANVCDILQKITLYCFWDRYWFSWAELASTTQVAITKLSNHKAVFKDVLCICNYVLTLDMFKQVFTMI